MARPPGAALLPFKPGFVLIARRARAPIQLVRITTDSGVQYNHATTSTGYACSSDARVHFGLGPSKVVKEIDIVWPSRIHQTLHNVTADRVVTITEAADKQ